MLRLLALAALPNALVVLAVGVVRVQNRPQWIVATHAALGAIVLTLTYGLLPRLGVGGVGLAWLVGQTLLAAVLGVIVLRPLLRQPETVSA